MSFFCNSHLQNYDVTMTENATQLSQTSSEIAANVSEAAQVMLITSQKKSVKKTSSLSRKSKKYIFLAIHSSLTLMSKYREK